MSVAKISIPNPQDVKDFPMGNSKAKIVNDRGHLRVIEREYYWSTEKKRGQEHRVYLGYVVDGRFLTNEQYRKDFKRNGKARLISRDKLNLPDPKLLLTTASALETVQAAEFPLYYAVAEQTGLIKDLTAVWGAQGADTILSVAFHWLHTSQNAAYLYESWCEGKLLPRIDPMTSEELSEFFADLASVPSWRRDFFKLRIERLPEDEILSYDATQVASEGTEISYAQYGKGKEGIIQQQVGLILLVGQHSGMPVLFRILPGNITDVTMVQDMLFRFGELTDTSKRVMAAVVDRGYFSSGNIASFIDHKSKVIMAANFSHTWIRDAAEKAMPELWSSCSKIRDSDCFGYTVPMEREFQDGVKRKFWVHVYRSDLKSHTENTAFFSRLDEFEKQWTDWDDYAHDDTCPLLKSHLLKYYVKPKDGFKPGDVLLKRDHVKIDETTRYFGMFANVSTMECGTTDALRTYRERDLIEKTFKNGKSIVEMDTVRAHTDNSMEGRFIISFTAMTILSRIYRLMNATTYEPKADGKMKTVKPLIRDMSFNEMRNNLSGVRMVYDGHGGRRWMEVTKKQHMIARRMGFPNLYVDLPTWGRR